jgi:hypothetical protein
MSKGARSVTVYILNCTAINLEIAKYGGKSCVWPILPATCIASATEVHMASSSAGGVLSGGFTMPDATVAYRASPDAGLGAQGLEFGMSWQVLVGGRVLYRSWATMGWRVERDYLTGNYGPHSCTRFLLSRSLPPLRLIPFLPGLLVPHRAQSDYASSRTSDSRDTEALKRPGGGRGGVSLEIPDDKRVRSSLGAAAGGEGVTSIKRRHMGLTLDLQNVWRGGGGTSGQAGGFMSPGRGSSSEMTSPALSPSPMGAAATVATVAKASVVRESERDRERRTEVGPGGGGGGAQREKERETEREAQRRERDTEREAQRESEREAERDRDSLLGVTPQSVRGTPNVGQGGGGVGGGAGSAGTGGCVRGVKGLCMVSLDCGCGLLSALPCTGERARHIVSWLHALSFPRGVTGARGVLDLVLLQGVHTDTARNELIRGISRLLDLRHIVTGVGGRSMGFTLDSGVLIASRYPVLLQKHMAFPSHRGSTHPAIALPKGKYGGVVAVLLDLGADGGGGGGSSGGGGGGGQAGGRQEGGRERAGLNCRVDTRVETPWVPGSKLGEGGEGGGGHGQRMCVFVSVCPDQEV